MQANWRQRLKSLEANIEQCWQKKVPAVEQVSLAFRLALESWQELKGSLGEHPFETLSEEIHFFKCVKPAFTSWLEYLPMVYLSMAFEPKIEAHAEAYWMEETRKLEKFIEKNRGFLAYYRSGKTHLDRTYFLPGNALTSIESGRFYDRDKAFRTTYDPLVALLIANQRYSGYASQRLVSLKG